MHAIYLDHKWLLYPNFGLYYGWAVVVLGASGFKGRRSFYTLKELRLRVVL